MCEFCHKHGEGKKWYLQVKNYSEDLLSDLNRCNFIEEFYSDPERMAKNDAIFMRLGKMSSFRSNTIKKNVTENSKKVHFGQVIPIEDVATVFGFATSIVRLECICRRTTVGPNQRYCYGISLAPRGGKMVKIINKIDPTYYRGPDNKDLEVLNKNEALNIFREYAQKGLCHTIWTFHTPFIAGICNCNLKECYAMKMTIRSRIPVMFKAEYVARINNDLCAGCKNCIKICPFNAIGFDTTKKRSFINQQNCYGCGICRSVCKKKAIVLNNRLSGFLA